MNTRSLIAKMLATILILFVFSIPFMSSTHAIYIAANSVPTTNVFLTPSRINGTTVGQTITVSANVSSVEALHNIELGLRWSNTTVAQCSSFEVGTIYDQIDGNYIDILGSIKNSQGLVTPSSWATDGGYSANGTGTLANFTFTIKSVGYADVHIYGMFLENATNKIIPCNLADYFTVRRGGVQYITEIQGNPSQSASVPPDNADFYGESVTQMSPTTIGGVSGLTGNMTFAINGTSKDNGAFGYFNVTIPIKLMNCSNPDNWVVEMNTGTGPVLESPTISSTATTTTVSLQLTTFYQTKNYATNIVNIYGTSVAVPEFASMFAAMLLITLLMLATLAATLFIITTRPHKRES